MLRILKIITAGAVSGFLLALALPPRDLWWLGPLCLAPVMAAVTNQGLIRGFLGGLAVPAALVLTIQANVFHSVPPGDDNSGWVLSACGFFGFLVAVVCCTAAELRLTGWRRWSILAALAIGLELALFPILPAHLGLTQHPVEGMLMLASVGGIWLVSFLLWASNAMIAEGILKRTWRPAAQVAAITAAIFVIGLIPRPKGPTVRVAAIQSREIEPVRLAELTQQAGREGARLVVWPEFSGIVGAPGGNTEELKSLSKRPGQPPFVTSFQDGHDPAPHNAASLFSAGRESARYFKRKLFGGESNMHTPGTEPVAASWIEGADVGLSICFDSCYPAMIRHTASDRGVGIIALPTIDPEATGAFIAAVHAAYSPFRAAESGLPIIRADGVSHSSIVDGFGRVVGRLGPRVEGLLVADVQVGRRWSLYGVLGDWFLYVALTYLAYETVAAIYSRRARGKPPSFRLAEAPESP